MRPPRHVAHEADAGVAQRRIIVRRFELGWARTRFATFGIAATSIMDISIGARVSCALICVTAPMQRCPRAPAPYAGNLQNSRWGQRLGPISAPHGLIGRYAKQNVRDDQCARRSVLATGRTCPPARHLIVAIAFVRRILDARLGRITPQECRAVLGRPNVSASQNEELWNQKTLEPIVIAKIPSGWAAV
jgi:hypothetical protein